MAFTAYTRNLYGPQKLVDLNIVVIQATMVAGAVVLDADNSSPETSIALGTAGQFTIAFPAGTFVHLVGVHVSREAEAAGVGQSAHWETMSASTAGVGAGAFETTSETVDTPVTPTDGSRIYVTLLVGQV